MNKGVILSTFNFGYPRLTLKERPKVISDIRRFPAHDFLWLASHCQTSRTNNKGDTGTFKVHHMGYFGTPWMTLNEELQGRMSECL